MKGSRFTEEQIIGILREQEAGTSVVDLYGWKAKYGGVDGLRRPPLKALKDENCATHN
jgi:putative transposase